MIKDTLAHAARYAAVHPLFLRAFEWLAAYAAARPSEGRVALDGDRLVALPQGYTTHPLDCRKFETHDRFIDIQYIVSGSERIYVGDPTAMTPVVPYDPEKDIAFFEGRGAAETLRAGEFLIIWPDEAHAPGCDPGAEPASVRKVVLKVAV